MPADSAAAAAAVRNILTPLVGEFVAKTSVSMASKRIGKTAETITFDDLPGISEALRPALRTLIGAAAADTLVLQIRSLR